MEMEFSMFRRLVEDTTTDIFDRSQALIKTYFEEQHRLLEKEYDLKIKFEMNKTRP